MEDNHKSCSQCKINKACFKHMDSISSLSFYIESNNQSILFCEEIQEVCPIHEKSLNFYCKSENKILCFKCLWEHNKCEIEEISQINQEFQLQIDQTVMKLEEQLEQEKQKIKSENKSVNRALNEQENKLRTQLDALKQNITKSIEEIFQEEMRKIEQDKRNVQQRNSEAFQQFQEFDSKIRSIYKEKTKNTNEISLKRQKINDLLDQKLQVKIDQAKLSDFSQIEQRIQTKIQQFLIKGQQINNFQVDKQNISKAKDLNIEKKHMDDLLDYIVQDYKNQNAKFVEKNEKVQSNEQIEGIEHENINMDQQQYDLQPQVQGIQNNLQLQSSSFTKFQETEDKNQEIDNEKIEKQLIKKHNYKNDRKVEDSKNFPRHKLIKKKIPRRLKKSQIKPTKKSRTRKIYTSFLAKQQKKFYSIQKITIPKNKSKFIKRLKVTIMNQVIAKMRKSNLKKLLIN